MANKDINRIKVILVEKNKTAKWLAGELGKDPATVSKWVLISHNRALIRL